VSGLTAGSVCTGIGGLDEAVTEVFGARFVWHAEIEPAPSAILEARYPGVPNLGDIHTIEWSTVERVDILAGGYPCQPFSAAGKRLAEADPRHLWPILRRAIRALRPRGVVLENVAGHLSRGFGAVLGDLAEEGYDARWTRLPAAEIGAPHKRERVFVLAVPHADR